MSESSSLATAFSPTIVRRALIMALVVGPILTLINQGDALWGDALFNGWKAALTFVVPYVVATVSAVMTARNRPANPCQAEAPSLGSTRPAPDANPAVNDRH